ncbi:hypothetical protein ABK040_015358 [Willaertia magna]
MAGMIGWDSVAHTVLVALNKVEECKLVVCLFAEGYSPIDRKIISMFEGIRKEQSVPSVKIFIVNLSDNISFAKNFGVKTTPSVVFFYEGKPMTISRSGWDDDVKLVGATSKENYVNFMRLAREVGEEGRHTLRLENH